MTDEAGIRPGEQAVELPEKFDAGLYYIGRIHTPWARREDCPKNSREARERGAVCTIEVDPRYAAGLKDVESSTHLLILYWMDQARRDLVLQAPRHYDAQRGTFALRSPVRPNPIAASVVELAEGRRQQAQRHRARLHRRHTAARHQAVFRLDRLDSRCQRRLACREEEIVGAKFIADAVECF